MRLWSLAAKGSKRERPRYSSPRTKMPHPCDAAPSVRHKSTCRGRRQVLSLCRADAGRSLEPHHLVSDGAAEPIRQPAVLEPTGGHPPPATVPVASAPPTGTHINSPSPSPRAAGALLLRRHLGKQKAQEATCRRRAFREGLHFQNSPRRWIDIAPKAPRAR